jgi:tetratricopeptide (TPR) repeat protein
MVYALLTMVLSVSPLTLYAQQTTVLVNSFENQTGDRTLDWIGEGLAASIGERLSAQRDLYIFGLDERFGEYDRLGIPETVSVSRATAIRMAWEMGADVLITGQISGTPESFQIDARLLNLVDDTADLDVTLSGKLDEVIPMAASLASQLSKQLLPDSAMPESDYATRPPVPRSAFEAYVRGVMASDSQRRVELLQSAIRLHPQYRAAIFQLGQVHYLDSNYKASSELLNKIPANAPEYPQAQFMVAMNAYHLGEFGKAAEIFSTLPPTYDVLVNRGASLAGTGDTAGAVSAWRRAVEQNPSGTEAPFNMAYLAFSRSEWDLASSRLAQFLQEHARDTEAVFLLGRVYESLGRADESRRLTGQALRLSPRLSRWLTQPVPNLVRVRTQFSPTELRMASAGGLWTEARRLRRAASDLASNSLTGPRP